jgi:hypothetical protein
MAKLKFVAHLAKINTIVQIYLNHKNLNGISWAKNCATSDRVNKN